MRPMVRREPRGVYESGGARCRRRAAASSACAGKAFGSSVCHSDRSAKLGCTSRPAPQGPPAGPGRPLGPAEGAPAGDEVPAGGESVSASPKGLPVSAPGVAREDKSAGMDYLAASQWLRYLRRDRLRILMYHSVAGEDGSPFTVRPAAFAEQMGVLADQGYEVISLQAGCALIGSAGDLRRKIVLTFDDGYRDFLTQAAPFLLRRGFPATLFVVPGMYGKVPAWAASDGACPLLSEPEVKTVRALGFEVGSHSMSHADLTLLPEPELARELADSRSAVESLVHVEQSPSVAASVIPSGYASRPAPRRAAGDEVPAHAGPRAAGGESASVLPKGLPVSALGAGFLPFAYPFGYATGRERAAVRRAGYSCGLVAGGRWGNGPETDPMALVRERILASDSLARFTQRAAGFDEAHRLWARVRRAPAR